MPAANFKILISRTDSIGDVILTLPMAGLIKKNYPDSVIFFLGRTYTKEIIALSKHVDEFINYDELEGQNQNERSNTLKKYKIDYFVHVLPERGLAQLAKQAKIPLRVGTTSRSYHWLYCNKLISLSRKNSNLHEAQLNIKLLQFLDIETEIPLNEIQNYYGFTNIPISESTVNSLIDKTKINVILHPKSKGSAKEWGLNNYRNLIRLLPEDRFKIFISGTIEDGVLMNEFIKEVPSVINLAGKLSLKEFVAFINLSDALVAASTGPLHIAAALNKKAIGLFSPKRPIHPGRWMPIGRNAHSLVYDKDCENCSKGKDCNCITKISPEQILNLLGKSNE